MCGSLGVTQLQWGTLNAYMSRALQTHAAGAPVKVIFTQAPGGVTDLLWLAHSFPSAHSGVRARNLPCN